MDSQQQFCLKWNSFGNNLTTAFSNLFKSETLADVTLFCEGVTFKAHKLILAACSKHLAELFETAPHHQNLLVILDGISAQNMAALLEFMYKGEVHVVQENLSSFLKAADCLQVKGLSIEHEKLAVEQSQRQQQQHQQQQMLIPSSNIMGPRNNKSTKLSSPLMTSHESLKSDLSHHHPHLFQPQHLNHHHINHTSHHLHPPPHTHNLLPSQQTTSSHLSSAYSSPVLSHYLNQYHPRPYETHLPHHTSTAVTASAASAAPALSSSYNIPKKRHLRNSPTHSSPSLVHDAIRASVLRDGSKPIVSASSSTNIERNGSLMSPGSVSYRPSSTSSLPTGQSELDQSIVIDDHSTPAQNSSGSYEMEMSTTISSIHEQPTIVVENSVEIASEIDSNCPEDLRMKSEIEQENDLKEDISTSTSYSNGSGIVVVDGCSSSSTSLRTQSPHLSSVFQNYGNNSNSTGSNVNSSSAHSMFEAIVDSHTKSSPLSDSGAHPANVWSSMHEKYLKKPNCVNTPDGKKLKCPFCERLYGYETNLRAHIRQRHQGIRVPCPFCTRTFTRNNTVRRHIAREHKTDLSLKAYHEVQNHHSHALQQHAILQQQLQQQEQQQRQQQQVSHSMLPIPLPPPSTSSLRQSQERRSSLDSPHTPPSSPHESEQKQHDSQL